MIHPWMHSQWQQLMHRYAQQRLPHALLFYGLQGLGKRAFAKQFANAILCETPEQDGQACGQCRSCTQFRAQTHPDFHMLEPDEPGKALKVDQIRQLIEHFSLARHYQRYRVAILCPADAMNTAAANSLLKSLEEPPGNTLIILITSQRRRLPATILSRCQHMNFLAPSYDMALSWINNSHSGAAERSAERLILAYGAPVKALDAENEQLLPLRDDIFAHFSHIALQQQLALAPASSSWLKSDNTAPIQWLYSWVSDLIRLKCHLGSAILNSDKQEELSKIAKKVELSGLFDYLDRIVSASRQASAPLNKQMVMDDLLIQWQQTISQ